MPRPSRSENSKNKTQLWQEFNQKLANIQIEDHDYDGQTAESGYNKAMFDLLRDPVSLGLVGSNSNRGHQR